MRISDWSSDVCSSDLQNGYLVVRELATFRPDVATVAIARVACPAAEKAILTIGGADVPPCNSASVSKSPPSCGAGRAEDQVQRGAAHRGPARAGRRGEARRWWSQARQQQRSDLTR